MPSPPHPHLEGKEEKGRKGAKSLREMDKQKKLKILSRLNLEAMLIPGNKNVLMCS